MANKTLVPAEEYLKMSFDGPEPEYVDGEIVERYSGSFPHSAAQKCVLEFFGSLRPNFSLFTYPAVTLELSPTRYRIADVAVFPTPPVGRKYPTHPPRFVIEIVSEDDRHVEILEKLSDYYAWGVKHIWLVDPWTRRFSVYDQSGLHEVPTFELPEFGAKLSPEDIFGQ
jgi:Uma2 family endonuclease